MEASVRYFHEYGHDVFALPAMLARFPQSSMRRPECEMTI